MSASHPLTRPRMPVRVDTAELAVEIPQYSRRGILAIWAAAALPMAALAWVVAPVVAARLPGDGPPPMAKALWLRSPRSPRTGLVGGRLWLLLVPLVAGPFLVGGLLNPQPRATAARGSPSRCTAQGRCHSSHSSSPSSSEHRRIPWTPRQPTH